MRPSHTFVAILALLFQALVKGCSETITDGCCSAAYEVEMDCEAKIYAQYGFEGGRAIDSLLDACYDRYSDTCEDGNAVAVH